MPAESSSNGADRAAEIFAIGKGRRLSMVLFGYVPFLHAAMVAACAIAPFVAQWPSWTLLTAPLTLFVLPPIVVRLTLALFRPAEDHIDLDSRSFLVWWFCTQWQMLFNRLGVLEEALRLVPGLYSVWLRLWGARIGGFVYWSPGCRILDRPWIDVGRQVVFGAGVRLSSHLITREAGHPAQLLLAPISIGEGALVGAHGLIGPGVRIHAHEMTPAAYPLPPFSEWRSGKRVRRRLPAVG